MPVSCLFSRTHGSTPGGIRRKKQLARLRHCCRISCRYDPTRKASYPANGRALTDDVADYFVSILSNGKVKEDKVGPHSDLIAEFPYMGAPHRAEATLGSAGSWIKAVIARTTVCPDGSPRG